MKILLAVSIICLAVFFCGCSNDTNMDIYDSFLNGELTVEWKEQQVHVSELFWNNDIEYCFFDIDGDGGKELHVRDGVIYYVVKAVDGALQIIFEGWWGYEPIVAEELCGIVRYQCGYGSEQIEFFRISADGSMEDDGRFYWYDHNHNGSIDEEDIFSGPGDTDVEQYVQYMETISEKQQENEVEWTGRRLKNFLTWQEAYIDFISKIHVTIPTLDNGFEYSLIYVDDDDIPELYVFTGGMALGEIIVSFYNGNIGIMNRDRCGIAYIEHGGLLYNANGAMGFYPCNVYMLKKGTFTEIGTGWCLESADEQGNICYDYFWEGQAVTEAEFNASIDELIDTSECVIPSPVYSEDEIWELLIE